MLNTVVVVTSPLWQCYVRSEREVWPYPDLQWPSFSPWSPYTVRTASTSLGWPLPSTSNGTRWRSRWAIVSYGKPRSRHSWIKSKDYHSAAFYSGRWSWNCANLAFELLKRAELSAMNMHRLWRWLVSRPNFPTSTIPSHSASRRKTTSTTNHSILVKYFCSF